MALFKEYNELFKKERVKKGEFFPGEHFSKYGPENPE